MDNSRRRPRTRGGDGRRRGVRVRGARSALAPMGIDWVGVAPTAPISIPRGSGSRGGRHCRALLQEPKNRLVIKDISEMPAGQPLETPLHVYRKRKWQPPVTAAQPPSTSPTPDVVVASVTSEIKEEPLSPTMSMPSPAVYVECGPATPSGSPMVRPVRPPRPRRILDEDDNAYALNFGSDDSFDESDEEVVSAFIPRVYSSIQETPVDEDEDETAPTIIATPIPATSSTLATVVDVAPAETHQPSRFYDFEWKSFPNPPIPPQSRRETFSESVGPTIPDVDPYDIFIAIWNRQFMEYIASETNRYVQQVAQQMMDHGNFHPNSRITQWYNTTADELYVYFGIIIAMGVVVKSRSVTAAQPRSTSSMDVVVASVTSETQEPLSPAMSVPSPEAFIEYESSPEQIPRPRPRQRLSNRKINYGSEPGSDDSGDEEVVAPMIPRTYRSIQETPIDTDIDAVEGPSGVEDRPSNIEQLSSILEDVPTSATERPWSIHDFEWSAFPNPPIPPQSRREIFSNNNIGPTIPCVDPYEIFVAIWDRKFMEHIAAETNRYAQQVVTQMLSNNDLHPNSRISNWYDTTVDELYVYFALIIGMGVVVKSRLEEYWSSTPDLFYTPGFSAQMSINRFILLNKCLHFNNNDDMCALNLDASGAKLFKIQPVADHCNSKFNSLYNLSRNISLDESLLQWKGLLDINQLIPNKAATVGIKTYEICESQTGYLWRFEIHTYKKSSPQQTEDKLKASTPATVLRLVHGLENRGHTLWMDNYYNSPILARRLKSLGFDCAGTLRTNRLYVPETLHNLTKTNMRPDEIAGLTSGDIDTMVWRDNSRVAMISTYHGNSVQLVRGSTKPILILDYNIMMGGVDKKDQMLAMYPIERKRTKIWYKKLFRRLLNVSVLNSFIIHKHNSSPHLSHRSFRIKLVTSILSKHRPLSIQPATPQNKINISHRITEYPFVNRQRQRRMCIVCKKRVSTFCVGCNKTLCIDPCFVSHHS